MTFRDHLLVHQTLWASFAISLVLLVVLTVTGASINEVVIALLAGIFAVSAVLAIIYQAFIYVKFRNNKRFHTFLKNIVPKKNNSCDTTIFINGGLYTHHWHNPWHPNNSSKF